MKPYMVLRFDNLYRQKTKGVHPAPCRNTIVHVHCRLYYADIYCRYHVLPLSPNRRHKNCSEYQAKRKIKQPTWKKKRKKFEAAPHAD